MVVVKLMGGLGNQMFQFAAGRALSYRLNSDLLLDRSFLDADPKGAWTKREFELDIFNVDCKFLEEAQIRKLNPANKNIFRILFRKLMPGFSGIYYLNEMGFSYQDKFEMISGDVYLNGYWQSEKYFEKYGALIAKDFQFRTPLLKENIALSERIKSAESVSLHVRRTDFIADPKVAQVHGVCTPDYYVNAVSKLKKQYEHLKGFVFSDDPQWAKDNIVTDIPLEYVTNNSGKNSYVDMQLMSMCKHNIIANSSFSWWAAWLNKNEDKVVCAPGNWFADKSINTKDLYPKTWLKL